MPTELPEQLRRVMFSQVDFVLQLEEDFEFTLATLLQLRREFRQAAERLAADDVERALFRQLLTPPGFSDPVARRRFRSPSPGFVVHPPESLPYHLSAGDDLLLPVVFVGRGRLEFGLYTRMLAALGSSGLACGRGRFTLLEVRSAVHGRPGQVLWKPGQAPQEISLPYQDLIWYLERQPTSDPLTLTLLTPARLLRGRRPLHPATFHELFPFALRRVTSMLYAWGDCELDLAPHDLIHAAASVVVENNALRWQDWRMLEGDIRRQDLGGLSGCLRLSGPALERIAWVLALLRLFNLGKGASYGAGHCLLT